MEKDEIKANIMLYLMLKAVDVISETDEELKNEIEEIEGIVQYYIGVSKGYQVFENGSYYFRMNEEIENPNVKFILSADTYKRIYLGETNALSGYMAGDITIEGDPGFVIPITSILDILIEYLEYIDVVSKDN